jgi:transposase
MTVRGRFSDGRCQSALKISQKLRRARAEHIHYSTITDWIRRLHRGEDITRRASSSGRLLDEQINILITGVLEEAPLHSVRSLSSAIKYPRSTVWRYLHAADYTVHHLHHVPRMLTAAQKTERAETARELKNVRQSDKHRSWHYFLTGDELWFCDTMNHDYLWLMGELRCRFSRSKQ